MALPKECKHYPLDMIAKYTICCQCPLMSVWYEPKENQWIDN